MNFKEQIHQVVEFVHQMNEDNSQTHKLNVLGRYKENEFIRNVLIYTYSPYVKFYISGGNVRKYIQEHSGELFQPSDIMSYNGLFDVLDALKNRDITGNQALDTVRTIILSELECSENIETLYNILDKDLKIRVNSKLINKSIPGLIPVFEVSLCNVYEDKKDKVDFEKDVWLASRKLDGCRCVTIIDMQGNISHWSRQGKEFDTLGVLTAEIKRVNKDGIFNGMVLDGEICVLLYNGDEDFKSIMKEIRRKNHTIRNPMYKVFDLMTLQEFETHKCFRPFWKRYQYLSEVFEKITTTHMSKVAQIRLKSQDEFDAAFREAQSKNWEGLVIRKNDCVICKRSDSMLKVKAFQDAEYVVEDIEFGDIQTITDSKASAENVVTNFIITHKGNKVSVGSGLSLEQRRYYRDHPEELIGKTVTIQYFEETEDKDGNISLRFPTLKYIYENGRDL